MPSRLPPAQPSPPPPTPQTPNPCRSGGADHVWLFSHDEGACWAPGVIANNSIILTHWGRQELNHTSNTAYGADR